MIKIMIRQGPCTRPCTARRFRPSPVDRVTVNLANGSYSYKDGPASEHEEDREDSRKHPGVTCHPGPNPNRSMTIDVPLAPSSQTPFGDAMTRYSMTLQRTQFDIVPKLAYLKNSMTANSHNYRGFFPLELHRTNSYKIASLSGHLTQFHMSREKRIPFHFSRLLCQVKEQETRLAGGTRMGPPKTSFGQYIILPSYYNLIELELDLWNSMPLSLEANGQHYTYWSYIPNREPAHMWPTVAVAARLQVGLLQITTLTSHFWLDFWYTVHDHVKLRLRCNTTLIFAAHRRPTVVRSQAVSLNSAISLPRSFGLVQIFTAENDLLLNSEPQPSPWPRHSEFIFKFDDNRNYAPILAPMAMCGRFLARTSKAISQRLESDLRDGLGLGPLAATMRPGLSQVEVATRFSGRYY
ncbi:hypothetical protein EDB84DRAFT_1675300 [Lactarius hengduanensis]|nr:hypothetical protein EDB84DRAFT_1675300 [Lactarius hengduanensis]